MLVIRRGGRILLRQREAAARRMPGFWDLPAPEDLPDARAMERLGAVPPHHYAPPLHLVRDGGGAAGIWNSGHRDLRLVHAGAA